MNQKNQDLPEPTGSDSFHQSTRVAKPLISTIIPTYRRPELLRRAIRSVLNQSYPHFQVCVYDNASGDETEQVVADFARNDPRVKYYCHDKNVGALNNFNFGLNRVDTPFFSFLSDDDLLLPDFMQVAMKELEHYPDALFFSGSSIVMTEEGIVQYVSSTWPSEGYQTPPGGLFAMLENTLTWTSILFRKKVIEEVGGLDPQVGAPSDLDFLLRIAARFPFIISSTPSAIFLDHPGSHSATIDLEYTWPVQVNMIRNLVDDDRIPMDIRARVGKVMTERLISRLFFVGGNSIRLKNYVDAHKIADILRTHYRRSGMAAVVIFWAWCCQQIPGAHNMFLVLNRIRKIPTRQRAGSLQSDFGKYAHYLKLYK